MVPQSQSYGTAGESRATNGHIYASSESAPLLSKHPSQPPFRRFLAHMNQDVDTSHGDLILLFCYIITGLVDSSAVFIWGAFASMQTGNTIYLGLGLADPSSGNRWIKSLLSISCFCFGAACFGWYHRFFTPRKRWVLSSSYLVQTLLITTAATIVTLDKTSPADKEKLRWEVLLPLALVAFGSSGQAIGSRALEHNSLTSVVLTSIYCDLFSDPRLLSLSGNPTRNQRVAAPLCVLIGAIAGGYWANSSWGLAGALWTAATMKLLIVLTWAVWKGAPEHYC